MKQTMYDQTPRARDEGLVIEELPDELLVYDLDRHRAHTLNRAAALVWRHCDGRTTVPEMVRLLHCQFNLPQDEDVVWLALARLQRANLLRERVSLPEDEERYSRRTLVRRLGVVGGLTVLLPLVEGIVAPEAAYALTCVTEDNLRKCPAGTPCGTGCRTPGDPCTGKKLCDTNGNCQGAASVMCT